MKTTHPDFRRSNDKSLSEKQIAWLGRQGIKAESNRDHVMFRGKSKFVERPGYFFTKGQFTVMPIMATDTTVEVVTGIGTEAENCHKTFPRLREALSYIAAK